MHDGSNRARRSIGCLLVGLAFTSLAAADSADEWETLLERDGVTLSRPQDTNRAAVPSRGVTVVEAPFFDVLAVIQDIPRHVDWRPRCVESRNVQEPGQDLPLIYSRSAGTWLVADRDSIVRSVLSSNEWGRDARIAFESVVSPLAPPVDGVVRSPWVGGHYALEFLGPERTRVTYQLGVDVGGYVPDFVMRFVSQDMPIQTLVELRTQVSKTRGEYQEQVAYWQTLDGFPFAAQDGKE